MSTEFYSLQDLADLGVQVKATKYAGIFRKMEGKEYEDFKKSIADHGLQEPIVINTGGVVLDGHHRFRACQETGQPPRFVTRGDIIKTELDERIYVSIANLERRHLLEWEKMEAAIALKPYLQEKAKLNMALGGKGVRIQTPLGRTLKRIAELAGGGKSVDTAHKAAQIFQAEQEDPEQYGKLAEDYLKGNITANKAYRKIIKAQALTEKKAELAQAETLTGVPLCVRS